MKVENENATMQHVFKGTNVAHKNWMSQTAILHNKRLGSICLPATHDSGTCHLTDVITSDPNRTLQAALNFGKDVADKIDKIPFIGKFINPAKWVTDEVIFAIKKVATATDNTIRKQLNDGIRALDIRVYYNTQDKQFYTYHGLVGQKLEEVLSEIRGFLEETEGEIVRISFSNFLCDLYERYDNEKFPYQVFEALVRHHLEDYAYLKDPAVENPFDQTYNQIRHQHGIDKSRAILLNKMATRDSMDIFWEKTKYYSSKWSDTSNKKELLESQKEHYKEAVKEGTYHEISLTLTPQEKEVKSVVVSSLAPAIIKLAGTIAAFWWLLYTGPIAVALSAFAAGLAVFNLFLPWSSLKQLSQIINKDLRGSLYFVLDGHSCDNVSCISLDFYEHTDVVNLAIEISLKHTKIFENLAKAEQVLAVENLAE